MPRPAVAVTAQRRSARRSTMQMGAEKGAMWPPDRRNLSAATVQLTRPRAEAEGQDCSPEASNWGSAQPMTS